MAKEKGLSSAAPEFDGSLKKIIAHQKAVMESKIQVPDVELAGCIVKRANNVFVAQSGSGKSLLAFLISWRETKEQNFQYTIYLDLDNPAIVYKDRYMNFQQLDNMVYITELDLANGFEEFSGTTPKEKAWSMLDGLGNDASSENCLIVIDSLQSFCDYNDLKELKRFFDICRRLTRVGATILILHHKSSKTEAPSFKGLSYIRDSADVMWEVVPSRSRSGIVSSITLTCTKNRSVISFTSFTVSFSTDSGSVNYDQNVLLEEELPVKNAILDVLRVDPDQKQADIVQAVKPLVNIGEKRIRAVLEKLVGLHILNVKQGKKNAKLYSINYDAIEPGFYDGLEEEEEPTDDDKVALPF